MCLCTGDRNAPALDFDGVAPFERRFRRQEYPPDRARPRREGHIGPVGRAADTGGAESVVVGGRRLQAGNVFRDFDYFGADRRRARRSLAVGGRRAVFELSSDRDPSGFTVPEIRPVGADQRRCAGRDHRRFRQGREASRRPRFRPPR